MSSYSRAFSEKAQLFPVLPGNLQRSDVQRLLRRVAPAIGMNASQLAILLAMIDETRPSDWTNEKCEPVCFAMQSNIAVLTGKSERTVRRTENSLEAVFGFIKKEVSLNGRRCRFKRTDGSEYRQGIVFSPLIEAIPQLLELEAELTTGRIDRNILKQKISAGKRIVRTKLMELQSSLPKSAELELIAQTFLSWPTRFYASVTNEALSFHLDEVNILVDELAEIENDAAKMSGRPDKDDRQFIQDTNQDSFVSCIENEQCEVRINSQHANQHQTDCIETKEKPSKRSNAQETAPALTPMRLYYLCSEEMQLQIQISQGARQQPNERDFIHAAIDMLQPLNIHPSAFNSAADQMGYLAAALCVLIIDRNRFHPITPIRSPGGVLRAMTQRHAKGMLNIEQSLYGLIQRARDNHAEKDDAVAC